LGCRRSGWRRLDQRRDLSPAWVELNFHATRTIEEVNVFTIADVTGYAADPGFGDTFSLYGLTDFKVQAWDGSAWIDMAVITGNNRVWRQVIINPRPMSKMRIYLDGWNGGAARIVEIEAIGY
jgi:hypothetical protein